MTQQAGRGNAGQILETLMKGQTLKYLIFAVLLLNFVQYFLEEAQQASLMLTAESPLLAWTGVFVTTIDELGWIGLLLAFELETYWLSYQALSVRWVRFSLQGLRVMCYVLLAHTIVSNLSAAQRYLAIDSEPEVVTACTLADQDVIFSQNLAYQLITQDNCEALTSDPGLFYLGTNVVTDASGYQMAGWHTWIDLQDALLWLLVICAIELSVRLQNAAVIEGRWVFLASIARFGYGVLIIDGLFWLVTGHYLYAFDQALWIGGFWAIEWNLKQWRAAIQDGTNHDEVTT